MSLKTFDAYIKYNHIKIIFSSRGQSWCRVTKSDSKRDWPWVRSPLEEMKLLLKCIFLFLSSGVEAKSVVEFHHLTRNASRIQRKVGNRVF